MAGRFTDPSEDGYDGMRDLHPTEGCGVQVQPSMGRIPGKAGMGAYLLSMMVAFG